MELLKNYIHARNKSTELVRNLEPEDCTLQNSDFVSPPKWHLGHTTWFLENFILKKFVHNYFPYSEGVDDVFAEKPTLIGQNTRPLLREVLDYRKEIDTRIETLLSSSSVPELSSLLELAISHEEFHQEELLADLKYIWRYSKPLYRSIFPEKKAYVASTNWLRIDEGNWEIGSEDSRYFFETDTPRHRVFLNSFEISSLPVLVGDYLDFLNSKAYDRPEFWIPEGYAYIQKEEARAPLYWFKEGRDYFLYTLNGTKKLQPEEPLVHINYFEADAYARWKGLRLPTEFEWEIAAKIYGSAEKNGNFLESNTFHPTSLGVGETSFLGRVWEWTSSAYLPYPRYRGKVNVGEFNGKFPNNKKVLRGGSCLTPESRAGLAIRYALSPQARWHFTGFRVVRDLP